MYEGENNMIYTTYRARTLFTGYKIGLKKGKLYVGVPNTKGEYVKVQYQGKTMTITDYEGFIKWSEWLPDKTWQNNGEDYRLAYFEWLPDGSKPEPTPEPEEEKEPEQSTLLDVEPTNQYRRER